LPRKRRDPPAAAGPPAPQAPAPAGAGLPAAREPAPRGATPLSARDEIVALALATGATKTEAARRANAGVRTVYDIARRPDVIERMAAIRLEILTEGVGKLVGLHSEAIETAAALMRDRDVTPHTRLWACQLLMERTITLTEHMDTRRELAELRQAIADLDRNRE